MDSPTQEQARQQAPAHRLAELIARHQVTRRKIPCPSRSLTLAPPIMGMAALPARKPHPDRPMHPQLLALVAATLPAAQPQDSDLLLHVPQEAFAVLHCADASTAFEQARRNDLFQLLTEEEDGAPLREVVTGLVLDLLPGDANRLQLSPDSTGQAVSFALPDGLGAGFLARTRGEDGGLLELLRSSVPLELSSERQLLGADVEVYEPTAGRVQPLRSYHYLIAEREDLVVALMAQDNVIELLADVLDTTGEPAPVTRRLEDARAKHGPAGMVELYVDFTPFSEQAARELQQAGEPFGISPEKLLGLEDTWLYATASLPPGVGVTARGHVSIPEGTFLARLADTFEPLPPDLLSGCPESTSGLHALHWDLARFYDQTLEELRQNQQEQGAELIDGALRSTQVMTGVDLQEEFLRQLSGVFALYYTPPERQSSDPLDPFTLIEGMGFLAQVADSMQLLDTFDALMETFGGDWLEDAMIGDVEARLTKLAREEASSGVAFPPGRFIGHFQRTMLEASIAGLGGGPSALGESRLSSIADGRSGASFLSAVRLRFLRQVLLMRGLSEVPEGLAQIFDLFMVTSVRRTPAGFDIWTSLE